jgi:ABC-type enterochelin transport system permease subunit
MADSGKSIRIQVLETVAALMTAAFGFIAALAWNGAIVATIAKYLTTGDGLTGLYIYAIIVTIIAVIAGVLIARALGKAKKSVGEK